MNWEAIGAIGEIVGAIAVVATLFYLAIQIRYASREAQSNVAWSITSSLNHFASEITSSPEQAALWTRGCEDFNSLSESEQEHFVVLIAQWANVAMALHRTKDLSRIPEDYWGQVKGTMRLYMEKPGFRDCVLTKRVNFPDDVFNELTEGFRDTSK